MVRPQPRSRVPRIPLLVSAALLAHASPAAELEEVIVTAQKREQRLEDVPITVTALSGEALARSNVTDLADIADLTPGLSFESIGLRSLAQRVETWGALRAMERLNLDGLLALWHPPITQ